MSRKRHKPEEIVAKLRPEWTCWSRRAKGPPWKDSCIVHIARQRYGAWPARVGPLDSRGGLPKHNAPWVTVEAAVMEIRTAVGDYRETQNVRVEWQEAVLGWLCKIVDRCGRTTA